MVRLLPDKLDIVSYGINGRLAQCVDCSRQLQSSYGGGRVVGNLETQWPNF